MSGVTQTRIDVVFRNEIKLYNERILRTLIEGLFKFCTLYFQKDNETNFLFDIVSNNQFVLTFRDNFRVNYAYFDSTLSSRSKRFEIYLPSAHGKPKR